MFLFLYDEMKVMGVKFYENEDFCFIYWSVIVKIGIIIVKKYE